ncbi:hypothetical protein F5Y19DRAFT_212722 [Xylariaceae sp. FL1651]|nr:hypothetical protein F5Y19DRAFT_212722 [Xylariaceae sp. FL1651]
MVPQRSPRPHSRILIILSIVVVLVLFWNIGSSVDTNASPVTSQQAHIKMSNPVISALKVSVRQTSPSSPQLTVGVTNTHSSPTTVFTWNSPLDPLAVQLGLLFLTPEGSESPIDIPTIQVRRLMPPPDDAYVTIEPGQTEERELVLKKPVIPLDTLQGRVKVVCKGEWRSVWPSKKEDMSAESLKHAWSDDALKGSFESEPVEIEL